MKSKIIDFFKEYRDKLNKFKALEIFKFISFVFPQFKDTNSFFNFSNSIDLPINTLKELIQSESLQQILNILNGKEE